MHLGTVQGSSLLHVHRGDLELLSKIIRNPHQHLYPCKACLHQKKKKSNTQTRVYWHQRQLALLQECFLTTSTYLCPLSVLRVMFRLQLLLAVVVPSSCHKQQHFEIIYFQFFNRKSYIVNNALMRTSLNLTD